MNNGSMLNTKPVFQQSNQALLAQKKLDSIGEKFLSMWQDVHGAPEGTVKVMVGQNGLMIFLENAFCKAEIVLAEKEEDRLLQQYINHLTEQMLPILTDHVEETINAPVKATSITSNIGQEWIMVFLKFTTQNTFQTVVD